ncbi:MAG: hypothetical protein ACTHJU_06030, partial [Sphingopyxis sp.]
LAFAAASSKSDQNQITALFDPDDPQSFASAWLRSRGLGWGADLVEAELPPRAPANPTPPPPPPYANLTEKEI